MSFGYCFACGQRIDMRLSVNYDELTETFERLTGIGIQVRIESLSLVYFTYLPFVLIAVNQRNQILHGL